MVHVVFDGSFDGLLTAIFEVYEYKHKLVNVVHEQHYQSSMFDVIHLVRTDDTKAARVWKGLKQKLSARATGHFYKAFLCEEKAMPNQLCAYARHAFSRKENIEGDYAHPAVLYVSQTAKKVDREKHRMEAFVRFQLLKDKLYYAVCQPDYNVLPLIEKHFRDRFADQHWLIYDATRKYGIHYNLEEVTVVEMKFAEDVSATDVATVQEEEDPIYRLLWKNYFDSTNIEARKNTRLHLQHMPRRYWKYLPEKGM